MAETPQLGDRLLQYATISLGDNSASLSFWWRVTLNSGSKDLVTWVSQSRQWAAGVLAPLIGDGDYTIGSDLTLYQAGSVVDHQAAADIPMSVSGQSNPLPPNNAIVSSFRPDPAVPRRVSRTYWPFVRSDYINTDTTLSLTGYASYQNAAETMTLTTDWGGSGFALRVQRYVRHKATGLDSRLLHAETSLFVGTQKRRLRGSQKATWES